VRRAAVLRQRALRVLVRHQLGDPEVQHPHLHPPALVLHQEDVPRLHVAVDEPRAVPHRHPLRRVLEDAQRLAIGGGPERWRWLARSSPRSSSITRKSSPSASSVP
jgi:hypothetical protein